MAVMADNQIASESQYTKLSNVDLQRKMRRVQQNKWNNCKIIYLKIIYI